MSKLKKRSGIYYYCHNQVRVSLKTSNHKIALKLKDEMDMKRLTGQLDQKRLKLLDVADKYLYHVRENDMMASATKKKVIHQISMFIEYIRTNKCNMYMDEVTPDLFHRYANWREIMSIKNDMMSLNKMFSWVVARGLGVQVTVPVGDYVIKKSHKHRAISHEEFLDLLSRSSWENQVLFKWLYYTGLRPSDVQRVTPVDIIHSDRGNFKTLCLTPQKTANSSGKEVFIPLHENLDTMPWILELMRNLSLDSARREIKKILGKEVTLYSLRYSFNARLKELGASLETRKDAMGHTNIRTTEGYSTPQLSEMAKYIDMMD